MFNKLINRYAEWRCRVGIGVWYAHYILTAAFLILLELVLDAPAKFIALGVLIVYISVWLLAGSRGHKKELYMENFAAGGSAYADRIYERCGWKKWWEDV